MCCFWWVKWVDGLLLCFFCVWLLLWLFVVDLGNLWEVVVRLLKLYGFWEVFGLILKKSCGDFKKKFRFDYWFVGCDVCWFMCVEFLELFFVCFLNEENYWLVGKLMKGGYFFVEIIGCLKFDDFDGYF